MEKVGKSGNADQHYVSDWIDVESSTEDITSSFNADNMQCDLPSVRVVEIFYKRINTEKEPQYLIMKMRYSQRQDV